jgi:transcriptional regulator with XRE-family HTH domain
VKVRLYKTYEHRRDPVIDEVLQLLKRQDMTTKEAAEGSGVSTSTLRNWQNKKTRRPQSITVEAIGRAAGYKRTWTKMNSKKGEE